MPQSANFLILLLIIITFSEGQVIEIQNLEQFSKWWSGPEFSPADNPSQIGLPLVSDSPIWYIGGNNNNSIEFSVTFSKDQIDFCNVTNLTVIVIYYSHLTSVILWPAHATDEYAKLPVSDDSTWTIEEYAIDLNINDQIRIFGVVMPTGYFVFDRISISYEVNADACSNTTTTSDSEISSTTPTTDLPTNATTEAPTEEPTQAPTTNGTTEGPIEDFCDAESCRLEGYCTSYRKCNEENSRWETIECGKGLFWNSYWNNETIGGSCDRWENLPEDLRYEYESGRQCFPFCYFEKYGECSNNFIFHPNGTDHRVEILLKCPPGLIWGQDRETCDFCYNIINEESGYPCDCDEPTEPPENNTTTASTQLTSLASTTEVPESTTSDSSENSTTTTDVQTSSSSETSDSFTTPAPTGTTQSTNATETADTTATTEQTEISETSETPRSTTTARTTTSTTSTTPLTVSSTEHTETIPQETTETPIATEIEDSTTTELPIKNSPNHGLKTNESRFLIMSIILLLFSSVR